MTDPRFQALRDEQDLAWRNPAQVINSVLGQYHPQGYASILQDPEVAGFAVYPEHEYQGNSSPVVFVKILGWDKLAAALNGELEILLSGNARFKVQSFFWIDYAVVMLGNLV